MRSLRRLRTCETGAAAVEFAFIGLLLFVSTIGIIEVGRALFLMNELAHAADRAARVVMLNFTVPESALADAVRDTDRLTGLVPENVDVDSPEPDPGTATFRNLTLSYPFTPMVSGLTIGSVTLTAERSVAR